MKEEDEKMDERAFLQTIFERAVYNGSEELKQLTACVKELELVCVHTHTCTDTHTHRERERGDTDRYRHRYTHTWTHTHCILCINLHYHVPLVPFFHRQMHLHPVYIIALL